MEKMVYRGQDINELLNSKIWFIHQLSSFNPKLCTLTYRKMPLNARDDRDRAHRDTFS